MIDGVRNQQWMIIKRHFQYIEIGKMRIDVFGKQVVSMAGSGCPEEFGIWIIDGKGNPLTIIPKNLWNPFRLVDWYGNRLKSIVIASPAPEKVVMFDGYGEVQAQFETPDTEGALYKSSEVNFTPFVGHMTGDSIPDVVLYSRSVIYIYKNEKGDKKDHPMGTGINYTL